MADLRLAVYRTAIGGAGLPATDGFVRRVGGYHRKDGAEAVRVMLSEVTHAAGALFCPNDLLAQGAIRALHDAGLSVPDDVAVVGFDDIDEGRYSVRSLTTVSPDKEQIAKTAVALLVALLDNGSDVEHDTLTSSTLKIREGTAGLAVAPTDDS